jgi:hypothetical protein
MGLKRSIVSIALVTAFSAAALVGPADASPAGGGSYAASVATLPGPKVTLNTTGTGVKLGSRILSTSTSVTQLHGTVKLRVRLSKGGSDVYSTTKTVSGKSGSGYWVTVPKSTFKTGIWYRLYAEYTATSGHIEKSSSAYVSFKF